MAGGRGPGLMHIRRYATKQGVAEVENSGSSIVTIIT